SAITGYNTLLYFWFYVSVTIILSNRYKLNNVESKFAV
ncbi:MAG: hypothetical protein ACJAXH_003121, partial [Colwellia sp.]